MLLNLPWIFGDFFANLLNAGPHLFHVYHFFFVFFLRVEGEGLGLDRAFRFEGAQ
jgi:hypothetical protein